jgi:hypothetical protein
VYVDRWKRRWQHREYPVPAQDAVVQVYTLPVPDGYVVLMRNVYNRDRHGSAVQIQTLADFTSVTYDGSFSAWKEFLAQSEWVPAELAQAHIGIDYGKRFSFSSPGFSLAYGPDLQEINANGELAVEFGFVGRDGDARLGITGVMAQPDMDKYTAVRINRHPKPFADSPRDYQSGWKDLVSKAHPQDGKPYKTAATTWAGTTMGGSMDSNVLYTVFYGIEGSVPDARMKQKLAQAVKGTTIQEH